MYHKIQIKLDYGEIDIYSSLIMTLFLLEDRDFKGFWMKIWNVGVSVITRSTFTSFDVPYPPQNFIYQKTNHPCKKKMKLPPDPPTHLILEQP